MPEDENIVAIISRLRDEFQANGGRCDCCHIHSPILTLCDLAENLYIEKEIMLDKEKK